MFRRSKVLVLAGGISGAIAAGTLAMAQGSPTTQQPTAAEARLAWAKRHVELVCRPLEQQKMFDKATRCYNDVARLMGAGTPETKAASAEAPPQPAPAPAKASAGSAPVPAASPVQKPRPATRPAPVRTAASKPAPVRVSTAPARPPVRIKVTQAERPIPLVAAPVSNRCSGMGCLKYTLLGVGF